jgi:hypothetical protein
MNIRALILQKGDRHAFLCRVALVTTLTSFVACDGNPITPPPPPPPPPPIVHVINTPPVIKSISASISRSEVEQPVTVTADVEDAETAPDQLTYSWTATAGTFTGSGRTVSWSLAKGSLTPLDVTIDLAVTEKYADVDDANRPVTRKNDVAFKAQNILRVHDSVAELTTIGERFLVDYFGNSAVSPEACLVDFWDGCRGKADELGDIQNNRSLYDILSASAKVAAINFLNTDRTEAELWVPCQFVSKDKATGVSGAAIGDCYLSAVYQQRRWWLCDSNFCRTLPSGAASPQLAFPYCGGRGLLPLGLMHSLSGRGRGVQ